MDEFGGDRSDDVVEQGGDRPPGPLTRLIAGRSRRPVWRPSRGAAILAAITLAAGLAVGYGAGRSAGESQAAAQSAGARPSPTSRASTFPVAPAGPYNPGGVRQFQLGSTFGGPALTQADGACSVQVGRDLQLGIQVANVTGGQVTLRRVDANLPMGGLKMVSQQWQPCGGLRTGYYDAGNVVGPNSTSWFSVTFRVLVKCPGPYPVMFTVEYDFGGHTTAVQLPGFVDLSRVSYSGCTAQ
jgi:hypothetical protein